MRMSAESTAASERDTYEPTAVESRAAEQVTYEPPAVEGREPVAGLLGDVYIGDSVRSF